MRIAIPKDLKEVCRRKDSKIPEYCDEVEIINISSMDFLKDEDFTIFPNLISFSALKCKLKTSKNLKLPDSIEYLNLSDNFLKNIDSLSFLKNLKILKLSNNKITRLNLKNFENLSELNADRNNLEIIPLNNDNHITIMSLNNNKLTEFSGIEQYKNLKILEVSNNYLNNETGTFKYLEKCLHLSILDLSVNYLSSLPVLKNINLTRLNISANDLSNLKCVKELKNLEVLDANFNRITEVKYLEKLKKLKNLLLEDNKIKIMSGFEHLILLKNLNLSRNNIKTIKNLENLLQLKTLYLKSDKLGSKILYSKHKVLPTIEKLIINQSFQENDALKELELLYNNYIKTIERLKNKKEAIKNKRIRNKKEEEYDEKISKKKKELEDYNYSL